MKKAFHKIISLCICLILILVTNTPIFATSKEVNNIHSNNLTILDIKAKYNPLRTNNENSYKLYKMTRTDFNDEDVKIERVTYYDEFNNKTKEYTNEEALRHLYEIEKQQPSLTTTNEISNIMNQTVASNEADRFERRVVVSFIDSKAKTKVIRSKAIDIRELNIAKLTFDAGLSFAAPVYSIITSAISQFLPSSISYKAGDVQQTEIYRHYEKYGQLRDKKYNSNPWFSPIIIKKRDVDLTSNYYIVDDKTGKLTKFYTDFGNVEMNYNPLYFSSDRDIINLALAKWNSHPYNHTYNWDKKLWPKDGKTNTYSPKIKTTISR
jgi:hypothetical protein